MKSWLPVKTDVVHDGGATGVNSFGIRGEDWNIQKRIVAENERSEIEYVLTDPHSCL